MNRPGAQSLRTKVMRRMMPLTMIFCWALWAAAAWRAHVQHIDGLTETLHQRLHAKIELMEARFDAIDDAMAAVAQSSVMVGAMMGLDLDRVALPYLRSIRLAGATTRNAALLDYRGEPILIDDPAQWMPPQGLEGAVYDAAYGRASYWIEGDLLYMVHPVRLGGTYEGALVASLELSQLFAGIDLTQSSGARLMHDAEARERLAAFPKQHAGFDHMRFSYGDGEVQGLISEPLARAPGLSVLLEKQLGGAGFFDNPVQGFLGAVFIVVLLMTGMCIHMAASLITRPIRSLIGELKQKGLAIDDADPDAAGEIVTLTRRFRTAAREVEAALVSERELNAKQRMFVSMVSHEFRTPLAIIDGTASALQRRRARMSEEAVGGKLTTIRTSVARLIRLMEGALVSASLESGSLKLSLKRVDLRAVVATLIEERRAISPEAEFLVDVEALPDAITVDERLIYSVVDNLLSNAIKYNMGTPRIQVRGWTEDAKAHLAIEDNGVGIPASELPRIGERFFRATSSEGVTGTGIGVSMVAMVAQLHDGDLKVESTLGEGSTFTVSLPVAGPAAAQGEAEPDASDPEALWRLVYRSRATEALTPKTLDALLDQAARNNSRVGVTGCLLHRDGAIAQALEGKRSELERMIAKVRRDPRHADLETVVTGPIASRAYPDWSMLNTAPPSDGDLVECLLKDIARRTAAAPRSWSARQLDADAAAEAADAGQTAIKRAQGL